MTGKEGTKKGFTVHSSLNTERIELELGNQTSGSSIEIWSIDRDIIHRIKANYKERSAQETGKEM
jgi:hypothetical protein